MPYPRGGNRRLAGLNALWLDLDTYRVPELAALPRPDVQIHILTVLHDAALPPPSLLVDSGRGFHCLWLIRGASPAALPRWHAVMKAFARWAKPLGADPACVDPARVDYDAAQTQPRRRDSKRHPSPAGPAAPGILDGDPA
jgi:hypothetical protein